MTDSSRFFTHEEFHMLNLQSDQFSGISMVLNHTSNDSGTCLLTYLSKPSKFDDLSYESLGTCQGIKALQFLLMAMLGSHDPGE